MLRHRASYLKSKAKGNVDNSTGNPYPRVCSKMSASSGNQTSMSAQVQALGHNPQQTCVTKV